MTKKNSKKSSGPRKKSRAADSPANEPHSPEPSTLSGVIAKREPHLPKRGTGPEAAGQSGSLQGLPREADVDSQSVEELVEEGSFYEANVVSGIENAPDPDTDEVRTHED